MRESNLQLAERKDRIKIREITAHLAAGWLALAMLGSTSTKASAQERSDRNWEFLAVNLADVEVKIVRGNIIVRRGGDSSVRVHTTQSGKSTVSVVPTIQLREGRNLLRIVASYARSIPRSGSECLPVEDEHGDFWATRDTLDVELQIPMRMSVTLRSMLGNIKLSGFEGFLDASTNDGVFTLEKSADEPVVTASGSVVFVQHGRGQSGTLAPKLIVHDGDIQLWVKRGESLTIDGRSVNAPLRNVEIARSNDAKSLHFTVSGEHSGVPMIIELSRGRLDVLPLGAP